MCAAIVAGSVARSRPAVCYWRTLKMGKSLAVITNRKREANASRFLFVIARAKRAKKGYKGPKGSCAESGVLVENCGRILEILRFAQYDTAQYEPLALLFA